MALALEESTQEHVFFVWLANITQVQVQQHHLSALIVRLVRMALALEQSAP